MKTVFSALIVTTGLMTAPAFALTPELSMTEQMQAQKTLLRPQAFNFFSDRYQQLEAMKKTQPTFKAQLDSQTKLLRPQQFNPVSDAYVQTQARKS
jgi:hypothetical protein